MNLNAFRIQYFISYSLVLRSRENFYKRTCTTALRQMAGQAPRTAACSSRGEPADDSTRRVMSDLCASKGTAGRPCRYSPPPPTPPEYPKQREADGAFDRQIPVLLQATLALSVRVPEPALSLPQARVPEEGGYGCRVGFFRRRIDLLLRDGGVALWVFRASVRCVRSGKSPPRPHTCPSREAAYPRSDAITRRSPAAGPGRPMKDPLQYEQTQQNLLHTKNIKPKGGTCTKEGRGLIEANECFRDSYDENCMKNCPHRVAFLGDGFTSVLEPMIRLSRRCFPPFSLTVLLSPAALFLTSASGSPAALIENSATEQGTPPSPTPQRQTIYSICSILVLRILGVVFQGYNLMSEEQQRVTPKRRLSMMRRMVFQAMERTFWLLLASFRTVLLRACSSSLWSYPLQSPWDLRGANWFMVQRVALAVWKLCDFKDKEYMKRKQRSLFFSIGVGAEASCFASDKT